ncbi:B12 binding /radical SAM domain-containing protein [Corallococcus coralloides DSM 2259]|uniref:B12 binding /radical SAM domain-containing protein n=1 Tax=Corallococcus coralloides (strain ATCC 25202 / DSM 2259 / NBRC 100086 / M2) TaxID=1144275 RepID=H8MFW2_CORCM|nr:MYXO-CTERM sorting domain-containing protein [Corallococcus coralloides]AFE07289.1 B12 binding /radical SAM domain-containing protein [Corallococcus coralloides DSM 2259]
MSQTPRKVSLVLSYQYPGKYAFTVLAGAVEADPALADVSLHFPRNREDLLTTVRERSDAGTGVKPAPLDKGEGDADFRGGCSASGGSLAAFSLLGLLGLARARRRRS